MKNWLMFFCFCCCLFTHAQEVKEDIYVKIKAYYTKHPQTIDFVQYKKKDVSNPDSTVSYLAYAKGIAGNETSCASAWLGDDLSVSFMLLHNNGNYFIARNNSQKMKVKKGESIEWTFSKYPSYNMDNLEKNFGKIQSTSHNNGHLFISTNKCSIVVDTSNYRIVKLSSYWTINKKNGFDECTFISQPASLQLVIKLQMDSMVLASEKLPMVTRNSIEKKREKPEQFKGKKFTFDKLLPFNAPMLTASLQKENLLCTISSLMPVLLARS